jgi:diguanylate cyclase (GGDEF)-like protein/PAS domain S-box-containing protein
MSPLTTPLGSGVAQRSLSSFASGSLYDLVKKLVAHLDVGCAGITLISAANEPGQAQVMICPSDGYGHAATLLDPFLQRVEASSTPIYLSSLLGGQGSADSPLWEDLSAAILPLRWKDGASIGVLYVATRAGRVWSEVDRMLLECLAAAAVAEIEWHREADGRQRAERELRIVEQALHTMDLGVTITDRRGRIVYTNPAEARMHGYRIDELVGRPARSFAPPELWNPASSVPSQKVGRWVRERTNIRKDGSRFPVRLWSDTIVDHENRPLGLVTCCEDITPWKQAESELLREKLALQSLVERSPSLIVRLDPEGRFIYLNPAAEQAFGAPADAILGSTCEQLATRHAIACPWDEAIGHVLANHVDTRLDSEISTRNGSAWYRVHLIPERGLHGDIASVLVFAREISAERGTEERMRRDSQRDVLTGLVNRSVLLKELEQACAARTEPAGTEFSLLLVDLDGFRALNDELGHERGDAVLGIAADRTAGCARPGDTVGRLGNDEFAIILRGADHPERAREAEQRIRHLLGLPFLIGDRQIHVSATIGSAPGTAGATVDELLKAAGRALSRSRPQPPAPAPRQLPASAPANEPQTSDVESRLRLALERDELSVCYQPIIQTATGMLAGMEAFVRWQHPDYGLIGPQAFLPIAEQSSLIVEIDRWVVRQVVRQAKEWATQFSGFAAMSVNVNFSGRHIVRPDAADYVASVLRQNGLDARHLTIEVTETAVMSDADASAATLLRMKQHGIKVCLSDFSTGYTSLANLRRFALAQLKIEPALIQRIGDDTQPDGSILRGVVRLARVLGLGVTGMGVETPAQLSLLQHLECDFAQGNLLGPAVVTAEAANWLATPDQFAWAALQPTTPTDSRPC